MFTAKVEVISSNGSITGELPIAANRIQNVISIFIGNRSYNMSWDDFSEMAAILGVKSITTDGRKLYFPSH